MRKNISMGQDQLVELILAANPGLVHDVREEHPIAQKMRLDIFIPALGIAFEYHGRQHYRFVKHFHKTLQGFAEAVQRDKDKAKICKQLGIRLHIISFDELKNLTPEHILIKLREGSLSRYNETTACSFSKVQSAKKRYSESKEKASSVGQNYKAKQKEKEREYRKQQYQQCKQWKRQQ